ncbi:MAG: type II toxin-antitoxin system prevent-host-death family antitoxin [Candidatus Sulfopaludibacter sp.]|nr:type II toxin-antitoxin system prevent-host-death family antitoxin [Candidatus Sulfopaludibacter sp.]
MVRTLRESKAKLSELVDAASRGEDVLITVRGKVKARLTKVVDSDTPIDGEQWAHELRAFRRTVTRPSKPGLSVERILTGVREDRF